MKTIMTYAICCSILSSLLIMKTSSSTVSAPAQIEGDNDAASLWEQALAAKGGREKLRGVSNLLESYIDKSHVGLYVFPTKLWDWTDDRPTWLGVSVEMINLDRDLSYFVRNDSGPPTNGGKYSAQGRGEGPLLETQLYYLMETQWVKPVPLRLYTGKLDEHPVDILQTQVGRYRYDYYLDKQSHLPLKVVFPWPQNSGPSNYGLGTTYATFADYADSNGIQMPRKVGHEAKPEISVSIQVNVNYNLDIFDRPPSLRDGPDAWRRKSTTAVISK